MRAFATALSLLLTFSISPLSSPLFGQPFPIRAFDVPSVHGFDALAADGLVAPVGWRAGSSEAAVTRNLRVGSVLSSDPGAYNVPGVNENDRALGFLQEKGRAGVIDVRFRNMAGSPIDAISVAFDAVQWKFSADSRAQSGLELLYSADGTTFVPLGRSFSYHAAPEVDFRPLVSKSQSVRVVARISGRWILPSLVEPGEELLLRWRSTNSLVGGVGFAVDNVRFEAHPVHSTADGDGFATLHNPLQNDSEIFSPGISQPAILRLRGRPGGPLINLTIELPGGWSIPQAGSIELEGPAFRNASLEVQGDRVTVRNAVLTDTQTGTVVFGAILTPADLTKGPAVFRIVTSTSEISGGKEIQGLPKPVLLRTIESLRQAEHAPESLEEIAVEGTLLCPYSFDDTHGEFYLEGGGSNIRVVLEERSIQFAANARLLVRGRYAEDRSLPTIIATEVIPRGTGRSIPLRGQSIRTLLAEPRRFEGSLVILRSVRKVGGAPASWPPLLGKGRRYVVTDAEGRDSLLVAVHPRSGIAAMAEPKFPLTICGILRRIDDKANAAGRMAILPRFPSDLNPVLVPPAPIPIAPDDKRENESLMPTLAWEPLADASRYHLQLSTDSAFALVDFEDTLLTEPAYRCPPLAPETVYFWRLRAVNEEGPGAFSVPRTFSTITHPEVRIVGPAGSDSLRSSSVMLSVARSGFWYAADQNRPDQLRENQQGWLKISVSGVVQDYGECDSLWLVRLARGENLVKVELVDRERRPLQPAVSDSIVVTVADNALILRGRVRGPDESAPILNNSSSLTLRADVTIVHLTTGAAPSAPAELAVSIDEGSASFAPAGTVAVTGLLPGLHRIRLELVNGERSPLEPRVFDEFEVSVPDSAPYVKILSPVAGDTLEQGGVPVIVERRNLTMLNSSEPAQAPRPFGSFVISVNGLPVDSASTDTLFIGSPSEGTVRVRVEALDASGSLYDPPVFDEVQVYARAPAVDAAGSDELALYVLEQNYPNPFNAETEIRFSIPAAGHVSVRVFNLLGQEVALLLDSDLEAGSHRVRWDGLNDSGKRVSSGIYMVRLQSGAYVGTRRMLLVK